MYTLFPDSEVFQKERPTKITNAQKIAFYKKLAKEIRKSKWSSSPEDDIVEDLESLYPFNGNGYELAKKLENYGKKAVYSIDTDLCEWLECIDSEYREIIKSNVKQWVKAHNPQPKFKIGSLLLITEKINFQLPVGKNVYITGINDKEAYYLINEEFKKNNGICIDFEKAERCCIVT